MTQRLPFTPIWGTRVNGTATSSGTEEHTFANSGSTSVAISNLSSSAYLSVVFGNGTLDATHEYRIFPGVQVILGRDLNLSKIGFTSYSSSSTEYEFIEGYNGN